MISARQTNSIGQRPTSHSVQQQLSTIQHTSSTPHDKSAPVDLVLERLEKVRSSGDGWVALCPAHEDREASLSIAEGRDGRALIHCFAGCVIDSILSALGLEARDLFADGPSSRPVRPPPPPKTKAPKATKKPKKAKKSGPWKEIRHHNYRDENGAYLYRQTKYESPINWRRHPTGAESSLYGLENLALVRDNVLFVSESEKDCAALTARGDVVAGSPGGATKWKDEFAAPIIAAAPRRIVVLPHNDEAGRTFAETVKEALNPEVLTSIRDVSHEGAPKGYDVAAWLEAGGDINELLTFCQPCGDLGKRLRNPAKTQMSALVHAENYLGTKPDIPENRCSYPRWIGQHAVSLRQARKIPGRCGHCLECKAHRRCTRLSRLIEGLSRWSRVEMLICDEAQYQALTRRLRRMRASASADIAHVSLPYPDGKRLVLTEAALGGEELDTAPATLKAKLEALLDGARDEKRARLDGSPNWRKRDAKTSGKSQEIVWKKIGQDKLDPEKRAAIFERFGCTPVKTSNGLETWNLGDLSELELEQLWWTLGWSHEDKNQHVIPGDASGERRTA